jgi:enoyl-CoA hydratase/carnithine racemase
MLREIAAALEALFQDPGVRVVVIASALEKFFSTGADLRVLQAMGPKEMREWVEICHALVRQIRQASKPLLGAIHGTAVGGGSEIVLNGDVRFAAANARLGQPEINIGFIPPVGTTQSLSRLLGRPRALRFLYEGTLVTAEEALGMGLVDFVVPPEKLRAEVQAYWGGSGPQAGGGSRRHPPVHHAGARSPLRRGPGHGARRCRPPLRHSRLRRRASRLS